MCFEAPVSGEWQGGWIYWIGPMVGTLAAAIACGFLAKRIFVATIDQFESDPYRMFHRIVPSDGPRA